jgi:hypothetical protein
MSAVDTQESLLIELVEYKATNPRFVGTACAYLEFVEYTGTTPL